MSRIERQLHNLHAEAPPRDGSGEVVSVSKDKRAAFARVTEVTRGSPADDAGLIVGDALLLFDTVDSESFTGMPIVVAVVERSEGQKVGVVHPVSSHHPSSLSTPVYFEPSRSEAAL